MPRLKQEQPERGFGARKGRERRRREGSAGTARGPLPPRGCGRALDVPSRKGRGSGSREGSEPRAGYSSGMTHGGKTGMTCAPGGSASRGCRGQGDILGVRMDLGWAGSSSDSSLQLPAAPSAGHSLFPAPSAQSLAWKSRERTAWLRRFGLNESVFVVLGRRRPPG